MGNKKLVNEGTPGKKEGVNAGPSLNKTLSPDEMAKRILHVEDVRREGNKKRAGNEKARVATIKKRIGQLTEQKDDIVSRKMVQYGKMVAKGIIKKAPTAEQVVAEVEAHIESIKAQLPKAA